MNLNAVLVGPSMETGIVVVTIPSTTSEPVLGMVTVISTAFALARMARLEPRHIKSMRTGGEERMSAWMRG